MTIFLRMSDWHAMVLCVSVYVSHLCDAPHLLEGLGLDFDVRRFVHNTLKLLITISFNGIGSLTRFSGHACGRQFFLATYTTEERKKWFNIFRNMASNA